LPAKRITLAAGVALARGRRSTPRFSMRRTLSASALENAEFSADELAEIHRNAAGSGVNLWARLSKTAARTALKGSPR
jgi:hypothetical protein